MQGLGTNDQITKMEQDIKSHFSDEQDIKGKLHTIEIDTENMNIKILELTSEYEKMKESDSLESVRYKEKIDSQKFQLQSLTKSRDDLINHYNDLLNKRGNLFNVKNELIKGY